VRLRAEHDADDAEGSGGLHVTQAVVYEDQALRGHAYVAQRALVNCGIRLAPADLAADEPVLDRAVEAKPPSQFLRPFASTPWANRAGALRLRSANWTFAISKWPPS
jgi:hypothetical protein